MPFDGKNFQQTKPNVFSLEGLIAWLETQDPATGYDWHNCQGDCLIGHYGSAMGVDWHKIHDVAFGDGWLRVASSLSGPATYGAALERARRLLAKRTRA